MKQCFFTGLILSCFLLCSKAQNNWYALTPAQIAQLQDLAEAGAGRSSVMARGVLCFFHGICYNGVVVRKFVKL